MSQDRCIEAYSRLKNLKLVGEEIGMKWQTVYVQLKKAGVKVTGDKARYGGVKDRLASAAERRFAALVPFAKDSNQEQFQASIDFEVCGWLVDIKAARLLSHKGDAARWGFCVNKQKDSADFFVFYSYEESGDEDVRHVFLMPREIVVARTSISFPATLNSKRADYMVNEADIPDFFASLGEKPPPSH